jgi:hypothetical protein
MRCFNKRVVAGLAAVALAVLVFAPSALGRLLPVLVAAACPIGMLLMMRGATSGACHRPGERAAGGDAAAASGSAEEEIARLRREVEQLRATQAPVAEAAETVPAVEDGDRRLRAAGAEERPG